MTKAMLVLLLLHCVLVAAAWSDWADWSECKCDQTQTRTRECLSASCSGPEVEHRSCTCAQLDVQDTCSNVCRSSRCVSGYVADPCDCSCFYHCVKEGGLWTVIQQCCSPCTVWDDYRKTCVRNPSDPDCVFTPSTKPPGVCPLSPGSSKTTFVLGGKEMSCGANTEFDQASCTCVQVQPSAALPLDGLIICITFDQPHPYGAANAPWVQVSDVEVETDPNICNVSGNCGYFNRTKEAHLEIPYFAGNHFDNFAFSFWYRRTPGEDGSMGLVHNGNCVLSPSFSLISSRGHNCGQLLTEDGSFRKATLEAEDGEWHMYTMSYNGSYVAVYLDKEFADGQALTGKTLITQCPMTIGSFLCADYFDGHMDSISIFNSALSKADVQSLYNKGSCTV